MPTKLLFLLACSQPPLPCGIASITSRATPHCWALRREPIWNAVPSGLIRKPHTWIPLTGNNNSCRQHSGTCPDHCPNHVTFLHSSALFIVDTRSHRTHWLCQMNAAVIACRAASGGQLSPHDLRMHQPCSRSVEHLTDLTDRPSQRKLVARAQTAPENAGSLHLPAAMASNWASAACICAIYAAAPASLAFATSSLASEWQNAL